MAARPMKKGKIIVMVLLLLIAVAAGAAAFSAVSSSANDNAFYRQYSSFDIIAGIDAASIREADGASYFTSQLPDGSSVRFVAYGADVFADHIDLAPGGQLIALDAVGAVAAYRPRISNNVDEDSFVLAAGGYTFSAATSVDTPEQLIPIDGVGIHASLCLEGANDLRLLPLMPNFIRFGNDALSPGSFTLDELTVYYDPAQKTTAIKEIHLYQDYYPAYLPGELYQPAREQLADLDKGLITFCLIVVPEGEGTDATHGNSVWFVDNDLYRTGALKAADGTVLDKAHAVMQPGTVLEVSIGDYTLPVELPLVERYTGAATMHDLLPAAYPQALGQLNVLAVPIAWADQPQLAGEETLQLFRERLGRVADAAGNVQDYASADDSSFALSEYYDIASYGRLNITTFLSDWYYSEESYSEYWEYTPDNTTANEILDWLQQTYPDLDYSRYDQDGNGFVDALILFNAGTMPDLDFFYIISYSGAFNYFESYGAEAAGTQQQPQVNNFTSIGYPQLQHDARTLIHEFAHGLGLIDYYDVTNSGIDAVGSFDMQSASYGDWNGYSKYAMGWLQPQVVQLQPGEAAEYTICSSALAGDLLVIPAAGAAFDGPFGEYVMLDLLTDDGVNAFDAAGFGLSGVAGVRISHVNAAMEKRIWPGDGSAIGTIHIANDYDRDGLGRYNIEVIQNGGVNTFTNVEQLRTNLMAEDLFYAGDSFRVADYPQFFTNGRMDDGSEFGYTVQVLSIGRDANGQPQARVRISAE